MKQRLRVKHRLLDSVEQRALSYLSGTVMSINWHDLRSLNGSQNAGFEELCCQLAGAEPAPHGSSFIRKGAPDAGVECYWKLPDGSEWGWQAKFFLSPPNNSQWAQVDKSVKTALDKHSQLSQYAICHPINRQDPRLPENRSFMDKWNEHVQKWEEWATVKGMAVTFEYWGAHELLERLSREEHRGRYYFWFHRDLFSQEWFHSQIEEAIANVGPRYSPELDVQLPIARGVIEVTFQRRIALDIDLSKVRPPYNSPFPDDIPTEEELKAQYDNFDAAKRDIDYAQSVIWLSVMYGGTLRATSLAPTAARLNGHHGGWVCHPRLRAKSGMRHLLQR